MKQPLRFVARGESQWVCHLIKYLYWLKQSPRAWFDTFTHVIEMFGSKMSKSEHSVFCKQSVDDIILLVVYVVYIVITNSVTLKRLCLLKVSTNLVQYQRFRDAEVFFRC